MSCSVLYRTLNTKTCKDDIIASKLKICWKKQVHDRPTQVNSIKKRKVPGKRGVTEFGACSGRYFWNASGLGLGTQEWCLGLPSVTMAMGVLKSSGVEKVCRTDRWYSREPCVTQLSVSQFILSSFHHLHILPCWENRPKCCHGESYDSINRDLVQC